MIGRKLSHYEVREEISRGGMGVVYRALDLKLDREVAIKVLPQELVSVADRKRRFIQEAKAAAALHHPHIATIFEIGEDEGVTFIAMELIDGPKLRDMLADRQLSSVRGVELAIEIAEGLARAHEKGIVHRDLKPANVMVTDDGHAKIIDFGIAKLIEPMLQGGSEVATALRDKTSTGQVIGTVAYMSPEQARGHAVDRRSDIFSFGVVLHEVLTGRSPFERDSGADTLSAILNEKPPSLPSMSDVGESVRSKLQSVLDRCLAKSPDDRYQNFREVIAELREARRRMELSGTAVATVTTRGTLFLVVGAVVAASGAAYWLFASRSQDQLRFPRLANPEKTTTATGVEDYPTWSPDGRTLAYAATLTGDLYGGNWDIWVTQVGVGQPVNRTADYDGDDRFPAWSPVGTQIAFWSDREGGGYFTMSALGGTPRRAVSGGLLVQPSPPQWSADGRRLACVVKDESGTFLAIADLATLENERVELPGRNTERFDLSWSPDNRFLAYVDGTDLNNDVTQLWVLRLEDGNAVPATDGWSNDWSPSWSADSKALYFVSNRGGSMDLWQQPVGQDGAPRGEPVALTTGVVMRHAAFSPDGMRLAYSQGRRVAYLWSAQLLDDEPVTWASARQVTFDEAYSEYSDLSPDGTRVVFSSDRGGNHDLWIAPREGGEPVQLTTDKAPDWAPRWSPDGQEIAFYSYRTGNRDIWIQPLSAGPARQLTQSEGTDAVPTWSPDGDRIAFMSTRSGNSDIWIVDAAGGEPRQLTNHPAQDHYPLWSPDGDWVVFQSNRSGRSQLWRVASGGGEAELLTQTSALYPRSSPDGNHIYFTGTGDTLGNIWRMKATGGAPQRVTSLSGKSGSPGIYNLAVGSRSIVFSWEQNLGDLWVIDVVADENQ